MQVSDEYGNRYSNYKAKCDFVLQELSLLVPVVTLNEKYVVLIDHILSQTIFSFLFLCFVLLYLP